MKCSRKAIVFDEVHKLLICVFANYPQDDHGMARGMLELTLFTKVASLEISSNGSLRNCVGNDSLVNCIVNLSLRISAFIVMPCRLIITKAQRLRNVSFLPTEKSPNHICLGSILSNFLKGFRFLIETPMCPRRRLTRDG